MKNIFPFLACNSTKRKVIVKSGNPKSERTPKGRKPNWKILCNGGAGALWSVWQLVSVYEQISAIQFTTSFFFLFFFFLHSPCSLKWEKQWNGVLELSCSIKIDPDLWQMYRAGALETVHFSVETLGSHLRTVPYSVMSLRKHWDWVPFCIETMTEHWTVCTVHANRAVETVQCSVKLLR